MDNFTLLKTIQEVGLGPALAIAILIMMFWLIKHIMRDHLEEKKNYQTIINNHINSSTVAMQDLAKEIKEHGRGQQEANRYVREEHREMLKVLLRINGGK